MSRVGMPTLPVGNEFIIQKPDMKVEVLAPEASLPPQPLAVAVNSGHHEAAVEAVMPVMPGVASDQLIDDGIDSQTDHSENTAENTTRTGRFSELPHHFKQIIKRYRLATAALVLLVVGTSVIILAGRYWTAHHIVDRSTATVARPAHPVAGLNIAVPAADLQAKLQSITGQPVTMAVGTFSDPISSDMIKGWLQVSANKSHSEYYIHVNEAAISNSLIKEANEYARTPVNQVTVNEDGASVVAVAGKDGRALSDPNSLKTQAHETAKNVLAGKGLQFNTPLATTPFQAVTPANFAKLLVSNVTTKKLWAYQNGQLVNTFLVSAGKPSTPTPLGEYHIYAKFTVQDMRGTNPDGTPYFQPAVPWVNYFYEGSAVHGVYWHPLSWFGNINSSHGCIGLPVDQAKWVFDWAPIGTTVVVNA